MYFKAILKTIKVTVRISADAIAIIGAYFFSAYLFNENILTSDLFIANLIIAATIQIMLYTKFGLYNYLKEFFGFGEYFKIAAIVIFSTVILVLFNLVMDFGVYVAIYLMADIIIIFSTTLVRAAYRIVRRSFNTVVPGVQKRAMVFGAGKTGSMVIQQLKESENPGIKPIIIIDDNPEIWGMRIHGVKIAGGRHDINKYVKKYKIELILLCVSVGNLSYKHEIMKACLATECIIKIMPDISGIISNYIDMTKFRDIEMADVIDRREINIDENGIRTTVRDNSVLITGGGGSIGSEICRYLVRFSPQRIIIYDMYENDAYELMNELKSAYKEIDIVLHIGTVCDETHLDYVFNKYRPDLVFHAAAHKHVPLMEVYPLEAVKNNAIGTWNVAKAADKYKVGRFVLISTDKAVNPSNVMGATKRMAEYILQYMSSISRTRYITVRFGNVLGSNGSVVPLFRKQIESGGPVTVTHRDVTRYFMTLFEAAQLVLQAASIADNGDIVMLDMGNPIRIDDIARSLIRLSGYIPDKDIKIVYTGLRPGEKLTEELVYADEAGSRRYLPGMYIYSGKSMTGELPFYMNKLLKQLQQEETMGDLIKVIMRFFIKNNNRDTGNSVEITNKV